MTDFRIRVVIDPTAAIAGAKRVEAQLGKTEGAADKLHKTILRGFAGVGAALLIRELVTLTDTYTNIQNRLRTVTESEEQLIEVTDRLFESSNRTRSSFEGTAEVYARVGLAARELGRTQSELLDFTESLNQAVILSGASAAEAQAGLIQLSQGLASGVLRGDELRSVLEQLPVVADVIAKSLGVTRGELRQLGADGKISAQIVLDAFKLARVELSERFAKSIPTIGQSFVVLKNNIIQVLGSLDKATGTSITLSKAIIGLANSLKEVAVALAIAGAAFAVVKLAPFVISIATATENFVKLRLAVLQGQAVILGSAEATRLQALATVQSAAADAEKTAAIIVQIEAEQARALVSTQSTAAFQVQAQAELVATAAKLRTAQVTLTLAEAENARLLSSGAALDVLQAAAVQEGQLAASRAALTAETAALSVAQAEMAAATAAATAVESVQRAGEAQLIALKATLTTQTNALTAAQGRLGAATAATTLRYKLFTASFAVNPFVILIAAAIGTIYVLDKLKEQLDALKETQQDAAKGEFLALSEFGKVGEQIRKVNDQIQDLQENLARDADLGKLANPAAVAQLTAAQLRLEELTESQERLRAGTKASQDALRAQREAMVALDSAFNKALASINQESELLKLNNKEREVQADLLKTIAQIEKEGGPKLTDDEREVLEMTLRRNQALRDQADILDTLRAPQENFERGLLQLRQLLGTEKITLAEFNDEVVKLAASTAGLDIDKNVKITLPNPLDFADVVERLTLLVTKQKELTEQEQFRKGVLTDLVGPLAELEKREQAIQQLYAQGRLTQDQYNEGLAKTREEIALLNPEYAAASVLLQELNGPTEELRARQEALNGLFAIGAISASQYATETAKITEALNPLTEAQKLQAEILESIKGPAIELAQRTEALSVLFAAGKINLKEYNKALEELHSKDQELGTSFGDGITSGLEKVGKQMQDIASLSEAVLVNAFNSAEDALVEFATTGQFSFKDFASAIIKDIARVIARLLILQAVQAVSGVAGAAHGGDVEANRTYIVGEKGPELFTPPTAGTIIPAGQTAQALQGGQGGGTTVVTSPPPKVNVNIVNVDDPASARDAMDTDDGAKVIMNQLRRNRSAVRRELS